MAQRSLFAKSGEISPIMVTLNLVEAQNLQNVETVFSALVQQHRTRSCLGSDATKRWVV